MDVVIKHRDVGQTRMNTIKELFNEYFEVKSADNQALIDESLRIRYQVYCVENVFEKPADPAQEKETDEYDIHSVHSIIHHKASSSTAATVRLVLPDPEDPSRPFPIEKFCGSSLNNQETYLKDVPRHKIAEISRFAVSKDFKRRLNEQGTIAGVAPDTNAYPDIKIDSDTKKITRMFPHISLGLFQGIVRQSAAHDIKYWYAVMEPSLLRLLSRFGIRFNLIGPIVDYHGKRQPCFAVADEVMAGIYNQRRDIWELITDNGNIWESPSREYIERSA